MRTKFSELLVAISPNLGPAQAICSNMEKCTVTPSRTMDDEKGYKKVLKDPVGQEIDKLLSEQADVLSKKDMDKLLKSLPSS